MLDRLFLRAAETSHVRKPNPSSEIRDSNEIATTRHEFIDQKYCRYIDEGAPHVMQGHRKLHRSRLIALWHIFKD